MDENLLFLPRFFSLVYIYGNAYHNLGVVIVVITMYATLQTFSLHALCCLQSSSSLPSSMPRLSPEY
jgi:hypothetical protein